MNSVDFKSAWLNEKGECLEIVLMFQLQFLSAFDICYRSTLCLSRETKSSDPVLLLNFLRTICLSSAHFSLFSNSWLVLWQNLPWARSVDSWSSMLLRAGLEKGRNCGLLLAKGVAPLLLSLLAERPSKCCSWPYSWCLLEEIWSVYDRIGCLTTTFRSSTLLVDSAILFYLYKKAEAFKILTAAASSRICGFGELENHIDKTNK